MTGPSSPAPATFPSSLSPGDSSTKNETARAPTSLWALPTLSRYVHKAQGLMLTQVVLNLERKDHAPGLSYVAISRVKTLSSIMFESPFDLSRFATKESSNMQDRARDWDLRTLQCL